MKVNPIVFQNIKPILAVFRLLVTLLIGDSKKVPANKINLKYLIIEILACRTGSTRGNFSKVNYGFKISGIESSLYHSYHIDSLLCFDVKDFRIYNIRNVVAK